MNAALHADDIPAVEPTALTSVPPENVGQLVFRTDPSTVWFGRPGLSIGSGGRISPTRVPRSLTWPRARLGSKFGDGTTSSRSAPRARRVRLPHRARGRGDAGDGHRRRLRGRPTVRSDVGAPHGAGRGSFHRLRARHRRWSPPMGRLRGVPALGPAWPVGSTGWHACRSRSINCCSVWESRACSSRRAPSRSSWEATLTLFRDEYRVPVLSPGTAAAVMATTFELVCPAMLILGLGTRLATLPLLAMLATIQLFVYPSAWSEHLVWGSVLFFLLMRGRGRSRSTI